MVVADDSTRVFYERLTPSFLSWLISPGVGSVFFIMFFPVSTGVAVSVGVVTAAIVAWWLWNLAYTVEITTNYLHVGKAQIELDALGTPESCSPEEMSHRMGPGSDARSFVLTRPWVSGGIYIPQTDPRDPTPYWLFSVRDSGGFVDALTQVREG